ncbi:carboxymuconolactone decarboxylase family protein [Aeromonas schubertii]|uniref:carboxymuconolactone decarboxylase family protein n=1 Tax=Aeromonas schubertii TaxID=652 RepID=UPI0010A8E6F3|nr:carboxymuconolactone decarboxylase family protein [Aeromonas schubertii]QCG46615.1 carboxymuconolactone decarboxylase family protein [Aeromonas schubertii]
MTRIAPVQQPDGRAATTLDALRRQLGMVPNLYATLAHSPTLLDAYLAFADALSKGQLTPRQREQLALAIGQANRCQYCLSAHTLIAGKLGLTQDEIRRARLGLADDARDQALLQLAIALVIQRGELSDKQLAEAREAGVDDSLLLEVLGQVTLNTLTNYGNHLAGTEVDFPAVDLTP